MFKYLLLSISFFCAVNTTLLSQNPGDNFFGPLTVHEVYIQSALPLQTFFDSLIYYKDLANQTGDNTYMLVDIIIDGTAIYDVGIRIKGNSSYGTYPTDKKSFKIDLDKYEGGQEYDGMDKINFNNCFRDPTLMREKLTLDLANTIGIPSPRCTYANVYLNNTLWGLYSAVEQVEQTFLQTWFGNHDGNLFKGDPGGNLAWQGGSESDYYSTYELESNTDSNDWSGLVNLIDIINNTSSNDFFDSLETVLETADFINYWALSNLLVNLDSYIGSGHNYYIYHNDSTGKFEWIVWDVNESFGVFSLTGPGGMDVYTYEYDYYEQGKDIMLVENMLMDNTYYNSYTDALHELLSKYINESYLYPIIDTIADLIRADVYADSLKMFSDSEFDNNIDDEISSNWGAIPGLKDFIKRRYDFMDQTLIGLGYPSDILIPSQVKNNIILAPTLFYDKVYVYNQLNNLATLKVIDVNGRVLYCGAIKDGISTIDLRNIKRGVYFYTVFDSGGVYVNSGKLISVN